MKRKTVMRILCISIVSTMLFTNTAVLVAGEVTRTVIYQNQQMTVTVNGDQVILPDGQIVSIQECQFIDAATPVPEVPETPAPEVPETPAPEVPETPVPEVPETPAPEVPETPTPEVPETPAPEVPETPTPEVPETPAPEVPETPAPEVPETPAPEVPETPAPEVPETPAPETPVVKPEEGGAESTISEVVKAAPKQAPTFQFALPSIKAGIGFYVDELKDMYHLEFSQDFAKIASEIEREYVQDIVGEALLVQGARIAADAVESEATTESEVVTESEDATVEKTVPESKVIVTEGVVLEELDTEQLSISVDNWQDVVAIYLLEQAKTGTTEFYLDANSKTRLAELVKEMNTPTITTEDIQCAPQDIADYVVSKGEEFTEDDKMFLDKYTSSNVMLLCAAATGAEGLIRQSLGEDVTAERAQVVAAAYSLVGKIPYFWGGKSSVVGWDDRWGNPETITAPGLNTSGSIQNFGLDCSGFITWTFVNGYENTGGVSLIGHGTATQWAMSEEIKEEEAQPGDLVFLQQPNAAGINHVGIVAGRNDDGSLIAVHCNAGKNGVTVDSAYQAGFRYVRRPLAYTDDETKDLTAKQERLLKLKTDIREDNAKSKTYATNSVIVKAE